MSIKKVNKSKKTPSNKRASGKHFVLYVEDCISKAKLFNTKQSAVNFIHEFRRNNKDKMDGSWADFLITDIRGEVDSLDSIEVEFETS